MNNPATARFRLARAWYGKGGAAPAMAGYREVLALEPGHLDAGDHRAAMSNLLKGIHCSRSEEGAGWIRSLWSRARRSEP